ncbi:Zn-ribbon domain-containing OB-fold protein [Streptomyces stelliscabiei]|uniref:Putative OB-fold protein n=1 Tax=Streptomyces stelliscabiei TaxID=146820 RepID=A0A8I0NV37_9ACTN|nr:OB-fold domain-containing protein [Streptomyces stelliscabiei]MBE1594118.1 putative OB-fold protein [Streptomyces stelliscabiei]
MTYAPTSNATPQNLPDVTDPATAAFWEAAREHRLLAQSCGACGDLRYPATEICPRCWSDSQSWVPIAPTGELYTYVVYHRALDPSMKDEIPYVVGRVLTDDGVVFTVRLDLEPDEARVGMRLVASWNDVTDAVSLLRFAAP